MIKTTDVRVLNESFELISIIDIYESFIWTDRFNECGDFELYTKLDPALLNVIQIGYYLEIPESDRLMVVESVVLEDDHENGKVLTIKGRSLESILDRRVIWDPIVLENVGFGSLMKTILYACFIDPTDPTRKVDNFIFDEPVDADIEGIVIEGIQLFGENLYDVVTSLCQNYRVGYKITLTDENKLKFSLYKGLNRTYDQDENDVVIFSNDLDNLLSSNFAQSNDSLKTACLVLGEGDGSDKTKVEVNRNGSYSGLARREMSISESIATDGTTVTNDNYKLQLYQKGTEALSENDLNTTFDGEVDPTRLYSYEKDYFLGDLVQTVNSFSMETVSRVVEYIRSYASSGVNFYPTFAHDSTEQNTTYNVISYNVVSARKAVEDAERAYQAANSAQDDADRAQEAADAAQGSADEAKGAATQAKADAKAAHDAADAAQESADDALEKAEDAEAAAVNANTSANGALNSLATVESVIDTLSWISEHGVYQITDDTTNENGKLYFSIVATAVTSPDATKIKQYYEKGYQSYTFEGDGEQTAFDLSRTETSVTVTINGTATTAFTLSGKTITFNSTPAENSVIVVTSNSHVAYILTTDKQIVSSKTYYTLDATPSTDADDPASIGLYELMGIDEAVNNYIMSHLSLTDDGLYVLSDDSGYKVLISNSSVDILDPRGVKVFKIGAKVENDVNTPFRLGGDKAYIEYYDSNNDSVLDSLKIVGARITIGGLENTIESVIQTEITNREKMGSDIRQDVGTDINNLETEVKKNSTYRGQLGGYIDMQTDPNYTPYITIGETSSQTKVQITNEQINFISAGKTTATANGQMFDAPQGKFQVLKMQTTRGEGNLRWIARSNGHVTLKVVK